MLITAVIMILTAIILGAFGAHTLKELLQERQLDSFETGVRYQMYAGLGMLVIGSWKNSDIRLSAFFWLTLIGVLLFSGSIYLLAIQDILGLSLRFLGPVTPLGGVFMIMGWSVLLIQLIKTK